MIKEQKFWLNKITVDANSNRGFLSTPTQKFKKFSKKYKDPEKSQRREREFYKKKIRVIGGKTN